RQWQLARVPATSTSPRSSRVPTSARLKAAIPALSPSIMPGTGLWDRCILITSFIRRTLAGVQSSGSVGELVVGASLGQAGFATGDIYAGSGADGDIFHYTNNGGSQNLFATLPGGSGQVRQIFFDPGSSFGGNMLVTTTTGNIYEITSSGVVTLLASIGQDTEGMDIATSAWGTYAGDLVVGSEASGTLRLISPGGVVTVLGSVGEFPNAETVSFVPLNLNASDPLQGFYVANFASNVQFAAASNFTGLLGDRKSTRLNSSH